MKLKSNSYHTLFIPETDDDKILLEKLYMSVKDKQSYPDEVKWLDKNEFKESGLSIDHGL